MDLAPLRRLKAEVDEQPHQVDAASRRRFLRGATFGGVAALGVTALPGGVLTAAAQTDDTTMDTASSGASGPSDTTPATLAKSDACETDPIVTGDDLAIVQFLESMAHAASSAYGTVVERRLLTALESETAHACERTYAAQAELLHCAAGGEPMEANVRLESELATQIAAATDEASLLSVLVELEDAMAATATAAVGDIESADVAVLVAAIAPVLAQQATVWALLAKAEPSSFLPSTQTGDGAFTVADYPVG